MRTLARDEYETLRAIRDAEACNPSCVGYTTHPKQPLPFDAGVVEKLIVTGRLRCVPCAYSGVKHGVVTPEGLAALRLQEAIDAAVR
jgi:hypothetical protein